jgi:hypothetical protein
MNAMDLKYFVGLRICACSMSWQDFGQILCDTFFGGALKSRRGPLPSALNQGALHQTLRKLVVLLLLLPSSSVLQNPPRTAHARPRPARPVGIPEGGL